MKTFSIYQVFSNDNLGFKGNTAAVVLCDESSSTEIMQSIAADLNQPATSFLWKESKGWNNRWFAPDSEILLCGHGAFASLAFLKDQGIMDKSFNLNYSGGMITGFNTPSGITIQLAEIQSVKKISPPKAIIDGIGIPILEMYETSDKHIIVVENEAQIRSMTPNFSRLRESKIFGYAITAPGDEVDFVSRTLVPHVRQLEDPATGSSHALLTPYWADRLKKKNMKALQLSKRGGYFDIEMFGKHVKLSGEFKIIAKGELIR